jgi:hypothetical protein
MGVFVDWGPTLVETIKELTVTRDELKAARKELARLVVVNGELTRERDGLQQEYERLVRLIDTGSPLVEAKQDR